MPAAQFSLHMMGHEFVQFDVGGVTMDKTFHHSQIRVIRRFTPNRGIEDMLKRLLRAHYNAP